MNAPLVIPTFLPRRGRKLCREAELAQAAEFRATLLALLKENGPLGSRALADMTGSKVQTIRDYMFRMINEGTVTSEKVLGKAHARGGTVCAVYSLGSGEYHGIGEVQRKTTRTKYPLHHVRDELVAALFGAPQLQG